jgi:5-methylcytosine-specific restriction endonuclease McrA
VNPCPKPAPRCLTKQWLVAEEAKAKRNAYARVTRRDGPRCRICGSSRRLEKHHVLARSLGGRDEPANLIQICGGPDGCHAKRHAGLIRITGNADERLMVWFDARVSKSGREETVTR